MIEVSVVIPTYDRRALLDRCLAALVRQRLGTGLYEVIVADDEASSKTRALVEAFSRLYPRHHFVYVPVQDRHGPAAARNQGWRKAKGRLIAFTDDDCLPDQQWLSVALEAFRGDVDAAWGRLCVPLRKNPTDYELTASWLGQSVFVTANSFCLKSVLKEVGGFDERFQLAWREDCDLYFTLLERRKNIVYLAEACVEHPVRPGHFGISLRQQKNNIYEALLFKKHSSLYRKNFSPKSVCNYYAFIGGLMVWLWALGTHHPFLRWIGCAVWISCFVIFFHRRIRYTSKQPRHILEMALTSLLIPPLSIIWRLAGAWRFKVAFM